MCKTLVNFKLTRFPAGTKLNTSICHYQHDSIAKIENVFLCWTLPGYCSANFRKLFFFCKRKRPQNYNIDIFIKHSMILFICSSIVTSTFTHYGML